MVKKIWKGIARRCDLGWFVDNAFELFHNTILGLCWLLPICFQPDINYDLKLTWHYQFFFFGWYLHWNFKMADTHSMTKIDLGFENIMIILHYAALVNFWIQINEMGVKNVSDLGICLAVFQTVSFLCFVYPHVGNLFREKCFITGKRFKAL